jgi:hypothetical protein
MALKAKLGMDRFAGPGALKEKTPEHGSPIHWCEVAGEGSLTQTRIKSYREQLAEKERREEQARLFRRNQAIGLVVIALAILLWWLFHTNPAWIFPTGWWRP